MAILPSPFGSNANPMRGAGLKRCPFMHPGFEAPPTLALGKPSTGNVPPLPPHWIMPLNGLPDPGTKEPANVVAEPSASMVGEAPAAKAVGSRLKACWIRQPVQRHYPV